MSNEWNSSRPEPRPRSCLGAALLVLSAALWLPWSVHARAPDSALSLAQGIRARGCGGHRGLGAGLHGNVELDAAAWQWAQGALLSRAIEHSGYRESQVSAIHVNGGPGDLLPAMMHQLCTPLMAADVTDLGVAQRGRDTWVIVAAPFLMPTESAAALDEELLQKINAARARARSCGHRWFAAVPPLQLESRLRQAAEVHAQDMLAHDYFSHDGYDGSTPATRVTATGYHYHIVGENIAYGPQDAAEAVQGWLASPGHCENIMDPRFHETGFALSANRSGTPRIYWVEDFAAR